MRSWFSLYKKELYRLVFFTLIVFLIVTGWQFFLVYKLAKWPAELVFGLSFLPFSFFPLIMLWQGYQSFRYEWKDDTAYFLLTLPRSGWQITLAKLTAGMTFYIGITLYNILILLIANRSVINLFMSDFPENVTPKLITNGFTDFTILYLISGLAIYILTQFSYLISRFYNRFNGMISIVIFVLSVYIVHRGGSLLAPLLKWMPDIPVRVMEGMAGIAQERIIYIGSGPLLGSLIMLILLFLAGSWIFEKQLEV